MLHFSSCDTFLCSSWLCALQAAILEEIIQYTIIAHLFMLQKNKRFPLSSRKAIRIPRGKITKPGCPMGSERTAGKEKSRNSKFALGMVRISNSSLRCKNMQNNQEEFLPTGLRYDKRPESTTVTRHSWLIMALHNVIMY